MDSDLLKAFVAGQVRHFVTLAAGGLVTYGAVTPDNKNAFIQIGSGIVMWVIAAFWSWWQKEGHAKVVATLKRNAPAAKPVAVVPPKPAAAIMLLVGASFVLALLMSGDAHAQIKRPLILSPLKPAVTLPQPLDIFAQLAAKVRDTSDLQAADALASAIDPDTNQMADPIAHACYQAEIKFFGSLPPIAKDATTPGPAVLFQRTRLIRLRLQKGLPDYLKIGCAPLMQDEAQLLVKIAAMVGVTVGTGGLGGLAATGAAGLGSILPLPVLP